MIDRPSDRMTATEADAAFGRARQRTVWVIHDIDYERDTFAGVAESLDAAVSYIKSRYPEPYIVTWDEPVGGDDYYTLTGHFKQVIGYSTLHDADFGIEEAQVRAMTTEVIV